MKNTVRQHTADNVYKARGVKACQGDSLCSIDWPCIGSWMNDLALIHALSINTRSDRQCQSTTSKAKCDKSSNHGCNLSVGFCRCHLATSCQVLNVTVASMLTSWNGPSSLCCCLLKLLAVLVHGSQQAALWFWQIGCSIPSTSMSVISLSCWQQLHPSSSSFAFSLICGNFTGNYFASWVRTSERDVCSVLQVNTFDEQDAK